MGSWSCEPSGLGWGKMIARTKGFGFHGGWGGREGGGREPLLSPY